MRRTSLPVSFARQQGMNLLRSALLLICCARGTVAQEARSGEFPRNEYFGGYLVAGQTSYSEFHFGLGVSLESTFSTKHGVQASYAHNFSRFLGVKVDFSLQPRRESFSANVCTQSPCSLVTQPATTNPKLFNVLAGPQFTWRNRTVFSPYAHALFGLAHASAAFSSSGSAASFSLGTSENGPALAFGGGFDLRINRRLSFRTGMDYNPAWVGRDDAGARTAIGNVRLWGGVLLH